MNLSVVTEIDMVEGYIGFYIESSNSYILRSDLNVINLENLTIEISKTNSKPFLVATWYRPPCFPTDLFSSYESFIGKLDSLDLEYYLLGDLNCDLVSPTPDANTHRLLEISDSYGGSYGLMRMRTSVNLCAY